MKSTLMTAILAAAILAVPAPATPGQLEPPGPPAPTMKPLDQVEPRIPIRASDLPLTIAQPGAYYLAENISTAGAGITIASSHVTLDLMGFTLAGGSGSGITASCCARRQVAVHNGVVSGWAGKGLDFLFASEALIEGVRVGGNGDDGMYVGGGTVVLHSTASDNGGDGIHLGAEGTLSQSTASGNDGDGIRTDANCVVTDSTASFNAGDGFDGSGSFSRCTAQSNTGNGFRLSTGSVVLACVADSNDGTGFSAANRTLLEGNTATLNGYDGIGVQYDASVSGNSCSANGRIGEGAGIRVFNVTGARIDGNHVTGNDVGIAVSGAPNVVVRNTARGNTVEYDITPGNKAGAISTDPVTAGPWDNFDF